MEKFVRLEQKNERESFIKPKYETTKKRAPPINVLPQANYNTILIKASRQSNSGSQTEQFIRMFGSHLSGESGRFCMESPAPLRWRGEGPGWLIAPFDWPVLAITTYSLSLSTKNKRSASKNADFLARMLLVLKTRRFLGSTVGIMENLRSRLALRYCCN